MYLQLKEMLSERLRSSPAEWFHEGSTTPMWDSKKMPAKPEWQMQCAITPCARSHPRASTDAPCLRASASRK